MLIVVQSCQWSTNLLINLSPRVTQCGQSIFAKLVKIIINRTYILQIFSNTPLFLLSRNGLQRIFHYLLLACVLTFLLNLIAVFYQYPQLASNGGIIMHLIEKTLGQCTLIMDNPQGGQFV